MAEGFLWYRRQHPSAGSACRQQVTVDTADVGNADL